ncbi:hypothetical protein Asal01_00168 [Fodinibius salicampi]
MIFEHQHTYSQHSCYDQSNIFVDPKLECGRKAYERPDSGYGYEPKGDSPFGLEKYSKGKYGCWTGGKSKHRRLRIDVAKTISEQRINNYAIQDKNNTCYTINIFSKSIS